MQVHPVTLQVPDAIFKQFKRVAEQTQRSVDQVMIEAISAAIPLPVSHLRSDLAQMALLNDAALWQASRATLSPAQQQQLERLHHQQRNGGLTKEQRHEMEQLETLYKDTILVRAQAAVLLKQRQYDVSDSSQFSIAG